LLVKILDIKQGDTCILILPPIPEWWEISTTCLRAGIVSCTCTTLLVEKDIEHRSQGSGATVFIRDEGAVKMAPKVRNGCGKLRKVVQVGGSVEERVVDSHAALKKVGEDVHFDTPKSLTVSSPGLAFFTSGTTGPPKMVLHAQASYSLVVALLGIHWLRLSPKSLFWNFSEMGWAKAAWAYFSTVNCGGAIFVVDDRTAFSAKTLIVLNKFLITNLCAPPTVYRQPFDLLRLALRCRLRSRTKRAVYLLMRVL
jgi:medium-chain acyl-CoA synthetase